MGRQQLVLDLRVHDHGLRLGREDVRVFVGAPKQPFLVVLAHLLEDVVAPGHDLGVGGDDELPVRLLHRVLDQVVVGGRLEQ